MHRLKSTRRPRIIPGPAFLTSRFLSFTLSMQRGSFLIHRYDIDRATAEGMHVGQQETRHKSTCSHTASLFSFHMSGGRIFS
jgi:hypothetical protein